MNAETDAATAPAPTTSARAADPAQRDLRRPLLAILGVQGLWLWWAFNQGWFLQADLSNMSQGVGRPLDWRYVTQPLGGHFAPINRIVYWVIIRLGQLDYFYTVAFRVGCQLLATYLLYQVLIALVGRRPVVLGVLAVYSLNPVLLAGGAWFTSGVGLIPAQVFALGSVLLFLRYDRDRSLRWAAAAGLVLALAVLAADQWVVTAPAILLLAAVHLYRGSALARLREFLRQWKAWLLIYLPLAIAAVGLLSFSDTDSAGGIGFSSGYRLLRESWLKTLGPSWIGGPWQWLQVDGVYLGYSLPPTWFVLLAQLGVLVTVLIGIRRLGWRSLAAWIMPVTCGAIGVLIIGFGRYSTYGTLLAIIPRYLYQAVAFFAIGATLALAPLRREASDDAAHEPGAARAAGAPRPDRLQTALGFAMTAAVIVACLVSGARFAVELDKSPARDYVTNFETTVRAQRTPVNLYDTNVPNNVITAIEPNHRVSDIVRLFDLPVRFQDPSSDPLVVTNDGHLAKASFLSVADGIGRDPTCGTYVHGKGTWTIGLDKAPHKTGWFLRLELYQAQPSNVRVFVLNEHGKRVAPLTGPDVHLGRLEARVLSLPDLVPTAVVVQSSSPATSLCIVHARIGAPFPAGSP